MAPRDPAAIFVQLTDSYMRLPLMQRIFLPLLIVGSVMAIVFISKWANKADHSVLFSDLDPADAAAVVEKLKALKIDYELKADGRTIVVSPPEVVHEMRLELASEGIPRKGSVGYELFDGVSMGLTQKQELLLAQRAKQGELERTILTLDAISSVRVHITEPEKNVFSRDEVHATASVLLKLRAGGELTSKQIKGIANLVAGSVEGLKPERVTVVDTYGNLLSQTEEERSSDLSGGESSRIEYQRSIEQEFVRRVEQMLVKVVGPGRAIARVTAAFDFSSITREEESFDPAGQVLRSERTINEGAGASQRGGVPGVVSNLTNDPNLIAAPKDDANNSSRNEAVKNYEVSKAITRSSSPQGNLTRLSIAVLVDGTYEEREVTPATGDTPAVMEKIFRPLDPEMLGRIEAIVKNAVGFDLARGDTISVESIPFHQPDESLAAELEASRYFNWGIIVFTKVLLPGLVILLFVFFVVSPMVKFLITPTEAEVDLQRLLPTGVAELEKELEQERAKATIPAYEPAVDLEQLEELMAENSRIVKENPQQAALLIRWWLNDGRL